MRHAETVTFGGSGLDRAADQRATAEPLLDAAGTRVLVIWRGKPLVQGEDRGELVFVSPTHEVLDEAGPDRIFLGRDAIGAIFAADISGWAPPDLDTEALKRFLDPSEQQHPGLPEGQVFAELRAVMAALLPHDAELAATAKAIFGWHKSHRFCAACGSESVMAMAGWQRDCPDCETHHFPRTDPVVIMLVTHGKSVLLGRSPGWPEGMYSLLAGFVEPGETIEAAVRREVKEESGISVGEVRYLASQPWPFPASLMIGCAGEALDTAITLDPAELEDALWMSREDMVAVVAGQHPVMKPARKGAIARFLLDNWLADRLD